MPTYTNFPRGSQARESTRFWKIEVQVGTKPNRPLDRANACESARRGSFNRTVVMEKRISIVHAFIKKTEATPERELKIARKRVKVLKNG